MAICTICGLISQHFRIDFETFLDRFLDRFGSFSGSFALLLQLFFRFCGVADVVIIVFVVINVIVVGGFPPAPCCRKKSRVALYLFRGWYGSNMLIGRGW